MDNDTDTGGESLTIDQAATRYAEALASKEVETDKPEDEEEQQAEAEGAPDEGDEADGETETEDQADDGEDEPETERGRFVADNAKVRLADGTVTTIAELKQGSLRNADYTRKTQDVAEQRKTLESQSTATKQREAQLAQREQYTVSLLQSILPKEPDPSLADPSSQNFDPVAYNHQRAQYEGWARHLAALNQNLQQSEKTKQDETGKQATDRAKAEFTALLEAMPELKDQAKANAFGKKVMAHGKAYEFTDEELREMLPRDHRFAVVLRDAIEWRELQAKKPGVQKKVEGRPPVQKGGKRLNPSESRARQANDAFTRLAQTGRQEDAVKAYLATHK